MKEEKKDNTNKTYFEKQVELYLEDLHGNPFKTFYVYQSLDTLKINHNVAFKSKIVKIQSPAELGCPFKVFVKDMTQVQIEFLGKLINYSFNHTERVEVVEFVEHPFSKNV